MSILDHRQGIGTCFPLAFYDKRQSTLGSCFSIIVSCFFESSRVNFLQSWTSAFCHVLCNYVWSSKRLLLWGGLGLLRVAWGSTGPYMEVHQLRVLALFLQSLASGWYALKGLEFSTPLIKGEVGCGHIKVYWQHTKLHPLASPPHLQHTPPALIVPSW
jgi:hypothetical protein